MLKANNAKLFLGKKKLLLENVNFNMQEGKINYLYGPNGIGKTSLIKSLLGIDFKITNVHKKFNSYFYLPQVQNKEFLFPCTINEVSSEGKFLNSSERMVKWNNASGGQRKKALLERAFSSDCELYVFDEPSNHLDQNSILKLYEELESLARMGKCVILIGHKLPKLDKELIVMWDVNLWR